MKNEDWKRVDQALRIPFGSVTLMCDGYRLDLQVNYAKMRLMIIWFVNGDFRAKWLMEETDIRRRFARPARIKKGSDLFFRWGWKSPGALIRHLKKTCSDVRILKINHCPMEETDAQVSG
ncbi:MAG: hypothetical protein RBR13_07965 [Tenuifilaceae bacterium]|nr:hypothetical protein [Tenuifilaceae bacterium]